MRVVTVYTQEARGVFTQLCDGRCEPSNFQRGAARRDYLCRFTAVCRDRDL